MTKHPDSPGLSTGLPRKPTSRVGRLKDFVQTSTTAVFIFCCSLIVTAVAWGLSDSYIEDRAIDRFNFQTKDIKLAIARRMSDQEKILLSGVGLFAASEFVGREEWKKFAQAQAIEKHYPGLQGFGFSAHVPAYRKEAHIAQIRAEGFPEFDIRPAGERPQYTSIIYLEPFDWRNRRAFGYDMFSEPVRRAAMERARDSGEAAISGIVKLVQETDSDVQAGFLLYLPVYRSGAVTETVVQRRAALIGYVYSPFRMANLMRGILGAGAPEIDFQIYDNKDLSLQNLLYSSDSDPVADSRSEGTEYVRTSMMTFAGRVWTLQFFPRRQFFSAAEQSLPFVVAVCGLLIGLLLFVIVGSLSKQRKSAVDLAEEMTSELRAQVSQTRAIVDTIVEGIAIVDENGRIEKLNPAATRIVGVRREDLIGMKFADLLSEDDGKVLEADFGRYLTDGNPAPLTNRREVRSDDRDGGTFPLEISISPMGFAAANKFTIALRDLTERERIDRMKNEFVATVSHELRTPLTCLVGSLGLAKSGRLGQLPEKVERLISLANLNALRLVELVNDILDMEKIQANQMDYDFGRVDIVELVQQALAELKTYGDKKHVGFRLEENIGEAYLNADRKRLFQVISNLLSNAVKFSPADAEVVVHITREDEGIKVFVRDNGPGIRPEFHDKIFNSFFQVDSSDSRNKEGTGLGLSICRAIIAKHGGDIGVESGEGGGSSFFFALKEAEGVRVRARA